MLKRAVIDNDSGYIIPGLVFFFTALLLLTGILSIKFNRRTDANNMILQNLSAVELRAIKDEIQSEIRSQKYPSNLNIEKVIHHNGWDFEIRAQLTQTKQDIVSESLVSFVSSSNNELDSFNIRLNNTLQPEVSYQFFVFDGSKLLGQSTLSRKVFHTYFPLLDRTSPDTSEVLTHFLIGGDGTVSYSINTSSEVLFDSEGNQLFDEVKTLRLPRFPNQNFLIYSMSHLYEVGGTLFTPVPGTIEYLAVVYYKNQEILGYSLQQIGGNYIYISKEDILDLDLNLPSNTTDLFIVKLTKEDELISGYQTNIESLLSVKDSNLIHLQKYIHELEDGSLFWGYILNSSIQSLNPLDESINYTVSGYSLTPQHEAPNVRVRVKDKEGNIVAYQDRNFTNPLETFNINTDKSNVVNIDFHKSLPTEIVINYEELRSVDYKGQIQVSRQGDNSNALNIKDFSIKVNNY